MRRLIVVAAIVLFGPALALCQQPAGQPVSPSASPVSSSPAATDYGTGYDTKAAAAAVMIAPTTGPRCPWMNLGTAAGLMGGTVTVNLTSAAGGVVTDCSFTKTAGAGELQLHVATPASHSAYLVMAQSICPGASVPLRAIGNEAIQCRLTTSSAVAGRVRDQVFTVSLTLPDKDMAATNVREAAEQLAGNLF